MCDISGMLQHLRGAKDVRVHGYCASLLRTLFIRHARAMSYIKRAHRVKNSTNDSADGRGVNLVREYLVFWMHGDLHFFSVDRCFSDSFYYPIIRKKNFVRGKF